MIAKIFSPYCIGTFCGDIVLTVVIGIFIAICLHIIGRCISDCVKANHQSKLDELNARNAHELALKEQEQKNIELKWAHDDKLRKESEKR